MVAAALSPSLNSLASTTLKDFYIPYLNPGAGEAQQIRLGRMFTVFWGVGASDCRLVGAAGFVCTRGWTRGFVLCLGSYRGCFFAWRLEPSGYLGRDPDWNVGGFHCTHADRSSDAFGLDLERRGWGHYDVFRGLPVLTN